MAQWCGVFSSMWWRLNADGWFDTGHRRYVSNGFWATLMVKDE